MAKKWSERSKGYKTFAISAWIVTLIFVISVFSATSEDNAAKEQLDKDAVAAGFASHDEKVAAEKAGFKDKTSYAKYLADIEAKKAEELAAQERVRQEAEKASEAENSAAIAQPQAEKRVGRDPGTGQTMDYWRNACAQFQTYRQECAVADNQGSCLESKLGQLPAFHLHWCQEGNWNNPERYIY
ncbi:hypothetical protein [Novosphingobium arvoryzae]|uniref:Uncharacterized protein n=1 Tax=Novosphingobium arvoryzae TaxID=1256514 RepID=A0A918R9G7_9SPHN|nr:hypothetical protein [Novosphingobium arvoryzae]GGZ90591.1 hypothetical protein GCM10011617_06940 [Novosphingobium arvoryzae]